MSELEKTNKVLKGCSKLSMTEALETTKLRLTALAACLKRNTRVKEDQRINRMFTTEPSKVYCQ